MVFNYRKILLYNGISAYSTQAGTKYIDAAGPLAKFSIYGLQAINCGSGSLIFYISIPMQDV